MGDKPAVPQSEWLPRTDAGARKLIERIDLYQEALDGHKKGIDRIADEVFTVQTKMDDMVTNKRLLGISAAVVVALGSVAWKVIDYTKGDVAAVRKDVAQVRKDSSEDIRQIRAETSVKVTNIESKVDGLFQHLIRGRSRSSVAAEVDRKEVPEPKAVR